MKQNNKEKMEITPLEKTLRGFAGGDRFYMRKAVGNTHCFCLCEFVEIRKGVIVGVVIDIWGQPWMERHVPEIGSEVTARAKGCMLWKYCSTVERERCHWFKSLDSLAD